MEEIIDDTKRKKIDVHYTLAAKISIFLILSPNE